MTPPATRTCTGREPGELYPLAAADSFWLAEVYWGGQTEQPLPDDGLLGLRQHGHLEECVNVRALLLGAHSCTIASRHGNGKSFPTFPLRQSSHPHL